MAYKSAGNAGTETGISHEIRESLGVISENKSGWTKELNLISWNGANPKYDIREWAPDHARMGRGLTFTQEEMNLVKDMLASI